MADRVLRKAHERRPAVEDLSRCPCARGKHGRLLNQETIRVGGAGEQGRLTLHGRFMILLAVVLHEHVADLAEFVNAAEDLVSPDLTFFCFRAVRSLFPGHRLVGAEINNVAAGIWLRQLLRAEYLNCLPEPYDPRLVVGHEHHRPQG